jgi:hypothetical protein
MFATPGVASVRASTLPSLSNQTDSHAGTRNEQQNSRQVVARRYGMPRAVRNACRKTMDKASGNFRTTFSRSSLLGQWSRTACFNSGSPPDESVTVRVHAFDDRQTPQETRLNVHKTVRHIEYTYLTHSV